MRVVPTESALRFVGSATWEALSGRPVTTQVFSDVPSVAHVRTGREADLVLVAPATLVPLRCRRMPDAGYRILASGIWHLVSDTRHEISRLTPASSLCGTRGG